MPPTAASLRRRANKLEAELHELRTADSDVLREKLPDIEIKVAQLLHQTKRLHAEMEARDD